MPPKNKTELKESSIKINTTRRNKGIRRLRHLYTSKYLWGYCCINEIDNKATSAEYIKISTTSPIDQSTEESLTKSRDVRTQLKHARQATGYSPETYSPSDRLLARDLIANTVDIRHIIGSQNKTVFPLDTRPTNICPKRIWHSKFEQKANKDSVSQRVIRKNPS